MMTPTAFALLQLSLVKGVGPARLRKALHIARQSARSLAALVTSDGLGEVLAPEQRLLLQELTPQAEVLAEKLDAAGVAMLCIDDGDYPHVLSARFPNQAPPMLMVRGNKRLLQQPAVGFCGSRAASSRGLEVAADCADQLARAGVIVTSGYAAGVDLAAHAAALRAGGATTVVLAEGIIGFRVKSEIEGLWDWDRVCVVSEFAATLPWSAGNAMQRNRTIVGLSRAMILIEAGATGGSIAAGRNALEATVPLFAPEYEGMPATATGNRELLRQGAQPLLRARATMRANLGEVLATVKVAATPPQHGEPQLPLLG